MADGYQEHMLSRSPYGERGLKSLGFICGRMVGGSLSLRRAWIEISSVSGQSGIRSSRSPYGERGLKSDVHVTKFDREVSLSLRRAWIEMSCCATLSKFKTRRSPYGERGLKSRPVALSIRASGRSPYGERGLKWYACCESTEKR